MDLHKYIYTLTHQHGSGKWVPGILLSSTQAGVFHFRVSESKCNELTGPEEVKTSLQYIDGLSLLQ